MCCSGMSQPLDQGHCHMGNNIVMEKGEKLSQTNHQTQMVVLWSGSKKNVFLHKITSYIEWVYFVRKHLCHFLLYLLTQWRSSVEGLCSLGSRFFPLILSFKHRPLLGWANTGIQMSSPLKMAEKKEKQTIHTL